MQIPPKVEYALSEIGKEFQPVLDSIHDWGAKYIGSRGGFSESESYFCGG